MSETTLSEAMDIIIEHYKKSNKTAKETIIRRIKNE